MVINLVVLSFKNFILTGSFQEPSIGCDAPLNTLLLHIVVDDQGGISEFQIGYDRKLSGFYIEDHMPSTSMTNNFTSKTEQPRFKTVSDLIEHYLTKNE